MVSWSDYTGATVTDCAPRRLFSVRSNLLFKDCVIFSLFHVYTSILSNTCLLSCVFTGVSFCHAFSISCLLSLYCALLIFSMSVVSVDHAGYSVNMSLKLACYGECVQFSASTSCWSIGCGCGSHTGCHM